MDQAVPVRRSTTRAANIHRVLEVLRTDGPSSQAAIARRTGLSPATINTIVKELRQDGAAEVRPVNGREALVSLVSKQGTIIAVEVAHDRVHGAAFSFAEGVRHDAEVVHRSDPRAVVETVRGLAQQAGVAPVDLAGVAIAMQAPIDRSTGAVAGWVTNRIPRWRNVPLLDTFSRGMDAPVIVDNDSNLAALAEWTWGTGRGADDFLYVNASEGVGGGLIIAGEMYRGGSGMAGDLGHLVLEPGGEVCYCGSRGCLTTLVSERAILGALQASQVPRGSLREVIESARAGDPACQRVLAEAGRYLGRALANTAKVVAPSVIAIGGILGGAGPVMFDGLRSTMEINNLRAVAPGTRFRQAQLLQDPALLGGVAAVLSAIGQGVSELPAWMRSRPEEPEVEVAWPVAPPLLRRPFLN